VRDKFIEASRVVLERDKFIDHERDKFIEASSVLVVFSNFFQVINLVKTKACQNPERNRLLSLSIRP
jgi:hypothetical protein